MIKHLLTVFIVDDEPAARRRLQRIVGELGPHVVGEAANGLEALERIPAANPDVVLLDVEMPEVDGLDVARRLTEPRPFIVFTTAYAHYAVDAFASEALDFVVKPVTGERLAQSFARVERRLQERRAMTPLTAEVMAAVATALNRDTHRPPPRRILVRHLAGHRLVPVVDILRFRAADDVVYAVMATSESIVDHSLDELDARLAGRFVRINRQDLIAVAAIERIESNGEGAATVFTRDGQPWRVSRRRAATVREALTR